MPEYLTHRWIILLLECIYIRVPVVYRLIPVYENRYRIFGINFIFPSAYFRYTYPLFIPRLRLCIDNERFRNTNFTTSYTRRRTFIIAPNTHNGHRRFINTRRIFSLRRIIKPAFRVRFLKKPFILISRTVRAHRT